MKKNPNRSQNSTALSSSKRNALLLGASLGVFALSCKQQAPPAVPDFCGEHSNTEGSSLKLQDSTLSYEKDILPILSSAAEGKNYGCTECHKGDKKINPEDKITAETMLTSIKNQSMPKGEAYDQVSADEIATIEKWINEKFSTPDIQSSANPGPDSTTTDSQQTGAYSLTRSRWTA